MSTVSWCNWSPARISAGSVRVEGKQKPAIENLHVSLQTLTPVSYANLSAPVKPDGRFAIEGVLPDKYRVNVFPQSDVYLRSIRYGNQEVKDGLLDLSGGVSAALELILGSDGAALSGIVQDSKQRPASGVTVVLVPDGVAALESRSLQERGHGPERRVLLQSHPARRLQDLRLGGRGRLRLDGPGFPEPFRERGQVRCP